MKRFRFLTTMCIALSLILSMSASAAELPYLEKIPAGQPIYDGPGYAYAENGVISENGTFTIVAETGDYSGNLWGKLKSGAGWINLTLVRSGSEPVSDQVISVEKADWAFLETGHYHEYIQEESDFLTRILFQPAQTVENVQLVSFTPTEAGLVIDQVLCAMPEIYPSLPLVAGVVFYGDMTTYGLLCTDTDGQQRCYTVSVSGYDGSLVVTECMLAAIPV